MKTRPFMCVVHPSWRDALVGEIGEEAVNRDYLFPSEVGSIDCGIKIVSTRKPFEYDACVLDLFSGRTAARPPMTLRSTAYINQGQP